MDRMRREKYLAVGLFFHSVGDHWSNVSVPTSVIGDFLPKSPGSITTPTIYKEKTRQKSALRFANLATPIYVPMTQSGPCTSPETGAHGGRTHL